MPALGRVNDILADHRCPAHRPPDLDAAGLEGARVGVTDIMGDPVARKRGRRRKLRELIAIAVIKSRKVIAQHGIGDTAVDIKSAAVHGAAAMVVMGLIVLYDHPPRIPGPDTHGAA